MALARVLDAFADAWRTMALYCTWLWFVLNEFLFAGLRDLRVPTNTGLNHKIVLIGDGLACGYGDYVRMACSSGLEARLLAMRPRTGSALRQHWKILSRGRIGSTSGQWAPAGAHHHHDHDHDHDDDHRRRRRHPEHGGFLENVLGQPACADAEIFVVCVGMMDSLTNAEGRDDPVETVTNIRRICEELARRNKTVLVSTIPLPLDVLSNSYGVNRARNELLRKFIDSSGDSIHLGAELDSQQMQRPSHVQYDGVHLSPQGYRQFAKLLMEKLNALMTESEWNLCQSKLIRPLSKNRSTGSSEQGTSTLRSRTNTSKPVQ